MHKEFEVDPNKCKRSGTCAMSCPLKLIKINDKDKLPYWIEGAEKECIGCGSCMASCPNQAIHIKRFIDDNDEEMGKNNLLKIDPQKCKHDGLCLAICPLQLITLSKKSKLPIPIDQAEKQCIHCGHCVAVCPYGALSLKTIKPGELRVDLDETLYYGPVSIQTMKSEDCDQINAKLLPSTEQIRQFLRARRSIRAYKSQPVDRITLSSIIETACYAPSEKNLQPVNWLVIENASEISLLAGIVIEWLRQVVIEEPEIAKSMNIPQLIIEWDKGIDRICHGAPHIIITHAEENLATSQTSCTIALTYLELAAFSYGLGTCWAGFFNAAANFYPPMMEALDLPDGHQCFGAMLVGYPRFTYHRIPLRKKAVVTWRQPL